MCEFFSCIIDKKGKVYWDITADSHEYLIDRFNLDADLNEIKKYVRIEVNPVDGDVFNHKLSNWKIKIDESTIPSWYERQQKTLYEKNIISALKDCFRKHFLIKQVGVKLSDGVWFIKDCKIISIKT